MSGPPFWEGLPGAGAASPPRPVRLLDDRGAPLATLAFDEEAGTVTIRVGSTTVVVEYDDTDDDERTKDR